jgi:hypothetical protein
MSVHVDRLNAGPSWPLLFGPCWPSIDVYEDSHVFIFGSDKLKHELGITSSGELHIMRMIAQYCAELRPL